MKAMVLILILVLLLVAGCATGSVQSTKVMPDGTKVPYKVNFATFFQDFKGSELAASLDATGKTTIKAGTVDNTVSPVAGDVNMGLLELLVEALRVKAAAVP